MITCGIKNIPDLSEGDFVLFQKLLVEESGLYFDKQNSLSLCIALWDRLGKRGCNSYLQYYDFLKSHPQGRSEMRELFDLITVGETYFFRNRPQFDALMKSVLPEIIQSKMNCADRSLRVWSAGCSKGDEAYSLAMAAMEILPSYSAWDISILGTDINRDVLRCAQEAVYREKDIGHLPEGYLVKYFKAGRAGEYELSGEVKKLARFEYHNLARDSFTLKGMRDLDIIFCRNVIIYFDLPTIKRAIGNFHDCLRPGGYLFMGYAESLWQISDQFTTVEFPNAFVYKKALYPVKQEAITPFIGVPDIDLERLSFVEKTPAGESDTAQEKRLEPEEKSSAAGHPAAETKDDIEALYKEGTRLFNEKKYRDALAVFDGITIREATHIRAYFAKATILANQAKYDEAIGQLKKITEMDNLHTEAYYLLGVLSYKVGDLDRAEAQFRKVVYVDPGVALAYFNLGNINLRQKKYAKAARQFNNAIALLAKMSQGDQVQFAEDCNVELLLRACSSNLAKINR